MIVLGADPDATMEDHAAQVVAEATAAKLTVLYSENGGKLDTLGREQFGFQDGISQPGVRGLLPGDDSTI